MRKSILAFMFLFAAILCILPRSAWAGKSLVEYQIAAVLMDETRNGNEVSMTYMANVLRNRLTEQHSTHGNKDVTYTDIIFNSGAFSHSGDLNSVESIERRWQNSAGWNTALRLAQQTVDGTLSSMGRGDINDFSRSGGPSGAIQDPNTGTYFFNQAHGAIAHDPSLATDMREEEEEQEAPEEPRNQHYSENSDGSEEAGGCKFAAMKQIYMDDSNDAKLCWYCNVVVVLMNSFFQAAGKALPSAIALGKLILEIGFVVWLAYYLLQQLASFTPITTGKLLQDILKMGFKVSLAYVFVEKAGPLIAYYFINPVLDLGLQYGLDLFAGLAGQALQ